MHVHGHQIIGVSLGAVDGEIGKVKDLYLDDSSWVIRYFIIQTDNWLFKKKVLIAPCAIKSAKETDLNVILDKPF